MKKIKGDAFVDVGAEYTFNAGGELEISTPFNHAFIKNRDLFNLKLGFGTNVLFNDHIRMYFNLDTRFLGYIQPV